HPHGPVARLRRERRLPGGVAHWATTLPDRAGGAPPRFPGAGGFFPPPPPGGADRRRGVPPLRAPEGAPARLPLFFPAPGAAPPHGQRTLRRRAADAGDRPRPDDESQAAHPRRGDRGAGAAAAA